MNTKFFHIHINFTNSTQSHEGDKQTEINAVHKLAHVQCLIHPSRMKIVNKLFTSSSQSSKSDTLVVGTIQVKSNECSYKSLLHAKNTSISSIASDMRARCGRMMSPLFEKTRSTGADDAGAQNVASNKGFRVGYWSLNLDSG